MAIQDIKPSDFESKKTKEIHTTSDDFGEIDDGKKAFFRENESWSEWILKTCLAVCVALLFLYLFLVGLSLLGNAFKVIAGAGGAQLFNSVSNPLAGLMVGIIATVLFQSSSTTTSIIVAAVGAQVLPVNQAIPMVFGANIGTSVTNTLVSLTFVKEKENYRRGFAGATVHDMFNYINVAFWFPLETITSAMNGGEGGVLYMITKEMAKWFTACDGECDKWEGPFKKITKEFSSKILRVDKDILKDISKGRPGSKDCNWMIDNWDGKYKFKRKKCTKFLTASSGICPDVCDAHPELDIAKCAEDEKKAKVSFKWCSIPEGADVVAINSEVLSDAMKHFDDFHLNKGGLFHNWNMSDGASGGMTLGLALFMITFSLIGLVKILTYLIRGAAENVIKKVLDMNGLIAITVGLGLTVLVQSSSITTSTLTPLVAMGILSLEKMFAFTVGANIGTTCTGILASLVGSSPLGFQIAMVHFLFNVFGSCCLYPIPFIRRIPLKIARKLGDMAAALRPFPIIYILFMFIIYPGFFLLLSVGFEGGTGLIVLATFALLAFIVAHVFVLYWFYRMDGQARIERWIREKDLEYKGDEGDCVECEEENGTQIPEFSAFVPSSPSKSAPLSNPTDSCPSGSSIIKLDSVRLSISIANDESDVDVEMGAYVEMGGFSTGRV